MFFHPTFNNTKTSAGHSLCVNLHTRLELYFIFQIIFFLQHKKKLKYFLSGRANNEMSVFSQTLNSPLHPYITKRLKPLFAGSPSGPLRRGLRLPRRLPGAWPAALPPRGPPGPRTRGPPTRLPTPGRPKTPSLCIVYSVGGWGGGPGVKKYWRQ